MAAEDADTTTWVRGLADSFHERWLDTPTYPLTATYYGIPGHDDQVPMTAKPARPAGAASSKAC